MLKKEESAAGGLRSGNATSKEKDIEGSASKGNRRAVGKVNGSKDLTTSGSSTESSSRKSTCQAAAANTSSSPNTSSQRRMMCDAFSSQDERERIDKISTKSPLRRSKRIRDNAGLASSFSEAKRNGCVLEERNQKDMYKGIKSTDVNIRAEERIVKVDDKSSNLVSVKKRRLDARSYRALFKSCKPEDKGANDSEFKVSQENEDKLSHVENIAQRAVDPDSLQKSKEPCDSKEEMMKHGPGEFVKVPIEECTGLGELGNKAIGTYIEGENTHSETLKKICSNENQESGDDNNCSDAKCIDSPVWSLPRAEATGKHSLQTPKSMESISEKPTDGESCETIGLLDDARINMDHHSTIPLVPVVPVVTKAAPTPDTMPPSAKNANQCTKLCTACGRQKSMENKFEAEGFCSCDVDCHSVLQGRSVEQTVLDSRKDEMVVNCERYDSSKCPRNSTKSKGEVQTLLNLFGRSLSIGEDKRSGVACSLDSGGEANTSENGSCAVPSNADNNACEICKRPGHLLCCDGNNCKRCYHLSCIDPPLKEVPPGIWHCVHCIRKRVELGSHSVSEGIESVLDAHLVETDPGDMRKEKQYLVKYKGLAHVHNRWIPEKELLVEAPVLLGKFNRRNQRENATYWKEEWTVPERLLQKRLLVQRELANDFLSQHSNNTRCCNYEWLVKWTGLGYECATWEFEKASFLCTPESMLLIKDFENRHNNARKMSELPKADKGKFKRQVHLYQLPPLPDSFSSRLEGDYLNPVNKLRECWQKGQHLVFTGEQDRFIKVIIFILSMVSDMSHPLLIISTFSSLSLWESEFKRLAPSVNVILYSGNKDVRKIIRSIEFYEEGGCVMFHVLLSLPHAVVEDFEALNCISWTALIVDDCQHVKISKYLDQLKELTSEFRLIFLNGQLKDNIPEYLNLLSFLDSGRTQCSNDSVNPSHNSDNSELAVLKDKLSKYTVHNRKPECPKISEFWVPVELSTVQLEQYCATLFSHSLSLRSCFKFDHVGVLHDILISLRKCCDHPYLVDDSLQAKLMKGLQVADFLDVGVKASGKLQFLDRILQEMKEQQRRAVVLFQLVGRDGKSTIGDILDDFLRQRFGVDSYERVDGGLSMSKKQIALNMFNNKENGRFVFLMENRACFSSIKLSSVDAVIIFSGDWNPANDIRALQKISIDSLSGHVKVFRLYSSFTVEERILIFAKQDKLLENNITNISCSVSQSLLTWGASHLFTKLDEFHKNENSEICAISFPEKLLIDDALAECLSELKSEQGSIANCSIITKAQHGGATYLKNIVLLGESKTMSCSEEPSYVFWASLLDTRYPSWKFVSETSQRVRRKPPCPDSLPQQHEVENEETRKRRKKLANSGASKVSDEAACMVNSRRSNSPKETKVTQVVMTEGSGVQTAGSESEEGATLHNPQKNLHLLLKPELTKLCEALELSADINNMAHLLLDFVMNLRRVSQESESILQAFKISLCWLAASILKFQLDHESSLILAKKYLNYGCTEEEVESVYSRLRTLRKKFKEYVSRNLTGTDTNSRGNASPMRKNAENELLDKRNSLSATVDIQGQEVEADKTIGNHGVTEWPSMEKHDEATASEVTAVKTWPSIEALNDEILNKRIKIIEKTCSNRMEKLLQKQQLEVEEFSIFRENEMTKQHKTHELQLNLLSSMQLICEDKQRKLSMLNHEFSNRMEKFEQHMKHQRKRLAVMQVEARNKEGNIRDDWLSQANDGTLSESFDKIPLTETVFSPDEFKDVNDGSYDSLINHNPIGQHPILYGSTSSVAFVVPDSTHKDSVPADSPPASSIRPTEILPVNEGALLVALPDRHAMENGAECAPASTSFEIQETSSTQALSDPSYDRPVLSHEQGVIYQSGSKEGEQDLSSSMAVNVLSTLEGDKQESGMDTSSLDLPSAESVKTAVNLQTTILDGLESREQPTSLLVITSLSSEAALHAEPSDQLTSEHHALNGLVGVQGLSFPHICSQEIRAYSAEPQEAVDLSNNRCNTTTKSVPESQRDELTDTWHGTNETQIVAQQSTANLAHQSFQELNSSHVTSLQRSESITMSLHPGQTSADMQPSYIGMQHGRTEHPTSTNQESDNHLLQASLVALQASVHDPLQNELMKISKDQDKEVEVYEKEKQRLKLDLEKELEEVRKKHVSFLNDVETRFMERKQTFESLYNKVYINRILSEEFRSKFAESKLLATGTRPSFPQPHSSISQSQFVHREALTSASAPLLSPGFIRSHSAASHFETSLDSARTPGAGPGMAPPSASTAATPAHVVCSSSTVFSQSRPLRPPVLTPRCSSLTGTERSPAPHLQPFRGSTTASMPIFSLIRPRGSLNQQQGPSYSMRPTPLHGASHLVPSLVADVWNPIAGTNAPNLLPTSEVDQRCPVDHLASSRATQPSQSSEPAVAPTDVICLVDD